MAVPATLIVVSPCSGWLYDKIGARYLTTAVSVSAVSLFWVWPGFLRQLDYGNCRETRFAWSRSIHIPLPQQCIGVIPGK